MSDYTAATPPDCPACGTQAWTEADRKFDLWLCNEDNCRVHQFQRSEPGECNV